jgi:hypothetical protein
MGEVSDGKPSVSNTRLTKTPSPQEQHSARPFFSICVTQLRPALSTVQYSTTAASICR